MFSSKRFKELAGILIEGTENLELNMDKVYVENDEEGLMAQEQLEQISSQTEELLRLMPKDAELEAWVQSKLTLATEMIDVVAHYLLDETPVEEDELKDLKEAEYQGRKVKLNKPMKGDVKKYKVYVKNPKTGKVKKVNFGDPNMEIRRDNPERRKSFRARHKCKTAKDKTTPRYWSCRLWSKTPVSKLV